MKGGRYALKALQWTDFMACLILHEWGGGRRGEGESEWWGQTSVRRVTLTRLYTRLTARL